MHHCDSMLKKQVFFGKICNETGQIFLWEKSAAG